MINKLLQKFYEYKFIFIKNQIKNEFIYICLSSFWTVIILVLLVKGNPLGWFLMIATIFMLTLFLSDTLVLAGLIFFIFVIRGTFEPIFGILPRQAMWASDIIILILFLKSSRLGISQGKFEKTQLFLPALLFFIWALLSGFLNGIQWFTVGVALKDFFRYVLLFYALVNLDIEEEKLKFLIGFFLIIIFMQIPITIFQYNLLGRPHDWVSGTLGRHGTGEMLVLVTCLVSVLMGFFIYYKPRLIYLLGIPCLLIPLILGSVRAALFYIPLTVIFISRKSLHGKTLSKTFKMFVILGIFVGVAIISPFLRTPLNAVIDGTVRGLKTQVHATVRDQELQTPGRFRAPRIAIEWINKDFIRSAIGYGFGSTKESYFEDYTGELFKTYSPRTNQIASTLIEMGFPGLVFYFWIIFLAFRMNLTFFKRVKDNYWKAVSFGVDGIIFMHLAGIFYHNIWRTVYSAFPFWSFVAIIYLVGRRKIILE